MIRTKAELKACIETLEEVYPPGKLVGVDPIGNYALGAIAGLKVASGEYPSLAFDAAGNPATRVRWR